MKYILMFILMCNLLIANSETTKTSELELFLFKIGFTSLLNDFENEKNITKEYSSRLEILEKKVQYILDKMNQKDTIFESDDKDFNHDQFKQLKEDLLFLSKRLLALESKSNSNSPNTQKQRKAIVLIDGLNARNKPYIKGSIVVRKLKKAEVVEIDFCNKYGWCKLKDKTEFVAKHLLLLK